MPFPTPLPPLPTDAGLPPLPRLSLFLDLDGTLAALEASPQAVGPQPRRNALVARAVARLAGRVAIISGRTVAEVDRILDGAVAAVAGLHGLERRTAAGERIAPALHPRLGDAKAALEAFAWTEPGLEVEDKGLSLALHFRRAPAAAQAARALVRRLAADAGLLMQEGDCVAELRPPGPDKGDAVAAFMLEAPFAGALPLFVGDDLTDEDGFRAARKAGGFGVLVGPGRPTLATHALPSVPAVLDWLEEEIGKPAAGTGR